ncbi:hypothetical protein F5I97DRAFT_1885800 [Phlebopus sp. FC_14]|nr:hypothetical protein F5I97DRAFT_1885800 [Phlebopus sp. FC_14]
MTKEAWEQVVNEPHKAKLSHELIAAAASYEAMKAYNDHCEKNGKPVSHSTAKEIMAAAGGAFIDGLFESKGLDAIDDLKKKSKAKSHEYHNDHLKQHY